mgnify:CR=1 FL=1
MADDVCLFEGFSKDESAYGCLSVRRDDGFGASPNLQLGTTNVDYSWRLFDEFQSLRTYNTTRFLVDPEGFTVATTDRPDYREEKIDLPALSEQTKQIFHTSIVVSAVLGLFLIWAQALPALRMFDLVQVWPSVKVIQPESAGDSGMYDLPPSNASSSTNTTNGSSNSSNGQGAKEIKLPMPAMSSSSDEATEPTGTDAQEVSITIADIGFSIVILIATWTAFRNIPGLIEIVVLQRLPLDAGSRYALSTVLRYLIAIVGILVAFKAVGISWANVQWLAAALTFGLAFGLQEIFAATPSPSGG